MFCIVRKELFRAEGRCYNGHMPEIIRLVLNRLDALVDIGIESQRIFDSGKKTQDMNFLLGRQFHSREKGKAVFLCVRSGRRTVLCRVVVCQGKRLQSVHKSHAGDVSGSHVLGSAGREAGMKMEIIINRDHFRQPSF